MSRAGAASYTKDCRPVNPDSSQVGICPGRPVAGGTGRYCPSRVVADMPVYSFLHPLGMNLPIGLKKQSGTSGSKVSWVC